MSEALNGITPPPPSLTESAGAAMASHKAGTGHMHVVEDVAGLDEMMNRKLILSSDNTVTYTAGQACQFFAYAGCMIAKGLYFSEVYTITVTDSDGKEYPNATISSPTVSGLSTYAMSVTDGSAGSKIPTNRGFLFYVPEDVEIGDSKNGPYVRCTLSGGNGTGNGIYNIHLEMVLRKII